jgi:prepilin-type N-terminal cleavage/methylation domain-containing protein
MDRLDRLQRALRRSGWTLLELLLVVTVLGIVAVVALPRFSNYASPAKKNTCYTLKGNLEVQAQLWYRNKGVWPAADFSDMAADPNYLPEGLPSCPVDGSAYLLDPATHRVVGHTH